VSLLCALPTSYDLHSQSPCVDQFKEVCDHHSSYCRDVCSYYQTFDHDVNSYPYYDIYDELYAKLNRMIETMNEQHMQFVSEMIECGLLHETYLSLPFPRLESSLYDDCESSLPLESNVVDDTPLTDLEEVFDPPLTFVPFVGILFYHTYGHWC